MASPTVQSTNDENMSPAKPTAHQRNATSNRRVLGEVSPNIKTATSGPMFTGKPLAGSPLKRSFTAAMEGGEGLMYLKRRKLSDDELLSQVDGPYERSGQDESGQSMEDAGSLRPVFQSREDMRVDIPTITEASPTEPNTPSEEDDSTQHSSEGRKSFSSLINYDPSSQTSTSIFKTISNAEMLKLRLRVAMYKVRTNQVETPFLDLHVEERSRASPLDPNAAAREAVEQLRQEAQAIAARDRERAAVPRLLPAPVLRPTAYSSRMIYDTQLPSSPPISTSSNGLPFAPPAEEVSTPMHAAARLDSPPSSRRRLAMPNEQELTSSVVKGRVAEGLLGLRHAV
ncbi:uncharacterized protein LTR77_008646 [Saxophila tyrrhenica]|uniref:Uncharacterized protein n=1 Tax=Saxophila tyrrhenica TaxID=1690608 RepID=A0AAV9P361_9PEZI|nr:hypothetical protein LTR77_008646 [Saxophila tyrrhenica]